MGEKLKKFVDIFEKKVDELIEKNSIKLEAFKKAREAALAITFPATGEYKTVGDLIKVMIPEEGGLNNSLYQTLFSQITLEKEDRAKFQELFKEKGSPGLYRKSTELKGKGNNYFNQAMQGIGSAIGSTGGKLSFKEIVGDGSDDSIKKFSEFVQSADDIDDALSSYSLSGLLSSREFYDAVVENGSPIGKTVPAESAPINAPAAEKTAEPAASINPPSGEKKVEAEKSTVNPITAPPVETAVEKTTGIVTAAPAALPKEVEAPKPSTAINISVETPKATVPEKETVAAPVGPPEKTAVTSAPIVIAPPPTAGAAQTATASPVNEEAKKKEELNSKFLAGFLGLGPTPETKTNVTSATQTINSPSTTQISNEQTASTVNQAISNTALGNTVTNASQATLNAAANTSYNSQLAKTGSTALANKYFKSIFSSTEEKKSTEPQPTVESTSPTAGNEPKAENMTEVSKTSPSFPEKIQPSSEKIIEKANNKVLEKTQEMMNQKETIKSSEKSASPVSLTENKSMPTTMEGAAAPASKSGMINVDGLEARLSRLEYLLSNPLEVKIIE